MIETSRLRLRRLRASDEPALIALDSDVEVMRYIGSRGGTPEQILHTISVGVPEKGMLTWGPILGAAKVAQVAAYVVDKHHEAIDEHGDDDHQDAKPEPAPAGPGRS